MTKGIARISALALATGATQAAIAQTSAEDLVRQGMAERGFYSGYSVQSSSTNVKYVQRDVFGRPMGMGTPIEWDGLRSSVAYAHDNRGQSWILVAAVQNFSSKPYCIRVKHEFVPVPPTNSFFKNEVNFILEPGRSQPVLSAASNQPVGFSYEPIIAFWPPNFSAPEGQKCKSVAPNGLQEWLDRPPHKDLAFFFPYSVR